MMKYYKIIPVSSYICNMYDTVEYVARAANKPYSNIMNTIGFGSKGDIQKKMINPPTNYFSIENLIMTRLNNYCRINGLNIRISRPIVRRPVNEIPNNPKNSGRNSLGWR